MSDAALPTWLFVSYGGGHVKALLPVARRVRELGIAKPVYLALTTAADEVRAAGLPVLGFRDVLMESDGAARAKGEELAAQLQVQAADRDESVAYLGLSYTDMEQRLGVEAAARAYAEYGRQAFLPLGVLERVIRKVAPALVVATNSPRAERAAIETARAMGVPSVCLVDLLGIWERELLARADYADAVCVLNAGVRDMLVRAGRAAQDVHVTGNPAFDSVHDAAMKEQGRRLREEAGWQDLHVCLYAPSPEPQRIAGVEGTGDPEFPRRLECALRDAVERNPQLALWVRRHPSEAPPQEVIASAHPRIRASGREMPLHAAIHASDEVLVTVSTVGVEAAIAGKPVTQLRGSILDHLSPYLDMGIASRELALDTLAAAFAPGAPLLSKAASAMELSPDATGNVLRVLQEVHRRHHG
ncbi:hypothetical protein [Ramlibacter sp.]|uniref:hypothetical protein n=1 Tax=Ramlibacter sp. TaxID=1917967 RepID=UPI001792581C|nr:hypothetical protein [Ramlibacter sp.]MBA2673746.1 hypothetical protein [Ramlibacter sp.]